MESSTSSEPRAQKQAPPHPFRYVAQKPNVRNGAGVTILPGQEYVGAELLPNIDWLVSHGYLARQPRFPPAEPAPAPAAASTPAPASTAAPAQQSLPPGPAVATVPPQIQKPNRDRR